MSFSTETPLLDTVSSPADLKRFSDAQLEQLADELRRETISAVSKLAAARLYVGRGRMAGCLISRCNLQKNWVLSKMLLSELSTRVQ